MGASVQPQLFDPVRERKAKLWAAAVRSGMSPEEATAFANQETVAPSTTEQAFPSPVIPSTPSRAEQFAAGLGKPGISESFQTGLRSGAAMGFDDEALGAISAGLTGADRELSSDIFDARKRMTRKAHPIASTLGEVGGSLIVPFSAADKLVDMLKARRAARGVSSLMEARPVASAIAPGAIAGGVAGAVTGAGESTGPFRQRVAPALISGAVGGGLGGALPIVGAAVRGAVRGGRGLAAARIPERLGAGDVAQGDELILRGLARDRVPEVQARAAAAEAQATGTPTTIADVGGRNMEGLVRSVESQPGAGSDIVTDFFTKRREGRGQRLIGAAERDLGEAPENAVRRLDDLIEQRRVAAKPLYERAYQSPPVESPALEELMEIPEFRDAYNRGRRIARIERRNIPALPDEGAVGPLPVQGIDYMKRGLDAMIEARAGSANALSRTEAKALRDRLEEVLRVVDDAAPAYGEARRQFAGDSRMKEAFENGQNVLKQRSALTEVEIKALTDAERELYREGAMDAIRDAVRKVGPEGDPIKRVFGNPETQDRIRALFENPDDFNRFKLLMEREARGARVESKALFGSPTQRIASEQADLAAAAPAAIQAASTGMSGALMGVLNRAAAASQGLLEPVRDAAAVRLTTDLSNKAAADALFQALFEGAAKRGQERQVRRAVGAAVTGQQAGSRLNRERRPQ